MKVLCTANIDVNSLSPMELYWLYNGMDCCITSEVDDALEQYTTPDTALIYQFTRAMQAPALEMMLRGFKVDFALRDELLSEFKAKRAKYQHWLDRMTLEVSGTILNTNSPKQVQELFYGIMQIPVIYSYKGGKKTVSTDRKALEKVQAYFHAAPIAKLILAIKDMSKKISVLTKGISDDGRIRTSYNVCGTETGRWSSSANAFGEGDNLQNWESLLRQILVADEGWKFAYIDFQQAESKGVAYISGDEAYIAACEGGDPHTLVSKMVWPGLNWNGDLKHDKATAEQKFYRHFSYRDIAKRGGHGCLTDDHEVLTINGWVPITFKPNKIMIFDKDSTMYFGDVSHWEDKEWSGEFIELSGTSIDAKLTSDHRVIFTKDQRARKFVEEPAAGFSKNGYIPLGENYIGGNVNEPLAELVAAFQCDGYQKSTNRVEFHFHKERKFIRLEMLAKRCGIFYERKGGKALLHWHCPYPKYAGAYLLTWNYDSLLAYTTEHACWDGHIGKTNSVTISSVDKAHLEWIQTVGRLVGIGGNFNKERTSGFGSTVFRLQQNHRRFATKKSINVNKEIATARVLCPTVSSGMFLVRRNGKIHVTGNTNYFGKPYTMAIHLNVEQRIVAEFQDSYFRAFPGIPHWHNNVALRLQTEGILTTALGRRRHFLGRRNEDSTLREAIAFEPQSIIGDLLNVALYRVWRKFGLTRQLKIIAQLHDAILVMYPEAAEDTLLPQVMETMLIPAPVNGRSMTIGVDAQVGWNWHKYNDKSAKGRINLDGLRDYTGHDERSRTRPAEIPLLDRVIC